MRVLCLNAGSSSLKVAMIDCDAQTSSRFATDVASTGSLRELLLGRGMAPPDAIGHRLVHGGPDQTAPLRLTSAARARLEQAKPFAPLHLPVELEVVDAATRAYPDVPQVACFDTAFHARLPEVARRLPFTAWANEEGVRRYGFHGLSYEYVVWRLGGDALDHAVVAHLGGGASMAAIHGGRSIDTTMGMSPTGGIMMGTRTGDVDPGALIHLMDAKGWGPRDVERFVNHECGLLGVSGTTSDMQRLLAERAHDANARAAVELFVYTAAKAIGALAVALGGLRTLVFTGGIGAGSAVIRAEVTSRLAFLGVAIAPSANVANAAVVSPAGAACTVHVLETDEELVIARHVERCLAWPSHDRFRAG